MENPSYIALSQQLALRRQMEVIANNLANAATPAYKAERILFAELVAGRAPYPTGTGLNAPLSFVDEIGTLRDTSTGSLMQTGNTFDLAIHGAGYFVVDTPAGQRFTRHGAFRLDGQGQIVTADGYPVLDQSNRPITVPTGLSRIEVTATGQVTSESGTLGQIRLVTFESEQAMKKAGASLYESEAEPLPPDPKAEIRQGMIEGSNVRSVFEITNMIDVLRRYQSAQRIIESEIELERKAIEKLSRVG
jgi:flagellar basal-body rod protein FlgF